MPSFQYSILRAFKEHLGVTSLCQVLEGLASLLTTTLGFLLSPVSRGGHLGQPALASDLPLDFLPCLLLLTRTLWTGSLTS
jgi:hypothetical protein